MNLTCAICSDLFMPSDDIHMTPCGHAFHYACLIQWLQRSKTCPQCRNKCIEKSLIKVYFNIVPNHDNPEDNATLLHKLDNLTLSMREAEKKLKDYEDKDASYKVERKKMKKTLTTLEDMIKSKDFTISAYKQEVDLLRGYRAHMIKLEAEVKELKAKIELMSTIEYVVSSTTTEVEEMLANDDNPRTLAVLVATLKRELKSNEIKKQEMRDRIKAIQSDLQNERSRRKLVEDKLSTAENELYRLEQEVKRLETKSQDISDNSESDSIVLNTPDQPVKRKRTATNLDESTPMSDKVRNILESDSPYLSIKSCSIGLAPILRAGLSATASTVKSSTSSAKLTKTQSDLSEKFSIFRKPRQALTMMKVAPNPNLVYNGLGGSEKRENFPDFPAPKTTGPSTSTTSIKARLKAGKFTRHPSTSRAAGTDELMYDITDFSVDD